MKKHVERLILIAVFGLLLTVSTAATTIRLATNISGVNPYERWERIAAAFHADNPDYQLEVEIIAGNEYPTKISVMLAAGVPPDVFQTWAQYKTLWAKQGLLLDLTPFWEDSEVARRARVFPFVLEAAMYNNRLVGVPYDFSSRPMVINLDAFNSAGVAIPDADWTVEDLRDYAIRLTRPDEGVYGVAALDSLGNWIWSVNSTGHGWLSDDRTEVLVRSPGYLKVLEYWLELNNLGAAPAPGRAPSRNAFQGGYAIWTGWAHYGLNLQLGTTYDWAMVPYPRGDAGNYHFAHGHMWSIARDVEEPEKAWKFLEWYLSPQGQRTFILEDGRQPLSSDPALWRLFFSPIDRADKQAMMYDLVIGTVYGESRVHTMQYWETWPDVDRIMTQYLNNVYRGLESPANAMERATTEIRALIAPN